jgi:hypothetical protein
LFRFEAKITHVKRSEKFEAKISEKREVKFYSEIVKKGKKRKNRLEFRFALFRFEAKITKKAKKNEKIDLNSASLCFTSVPLTF